MPGGAACLLDWFKQLWVYCEAHKDRLEGDPRFRIAENWTRWRLEALDESQDERLTALIKSRGLAARRRFIRGIYEWSEEEFGNSAEDAAWLILHQLAALDEFASWQPLRRYRQVRGLHVVLVPKTPGSPPAVVTPMRVVLLTRKDNPGWEYSGLWFEFESNPKPVQSAVSSVFGGLSFLHFALFWAVCGWTCRWSRARTLALILGAVGSLALGLLLGANPLPEWLLRWSTLTLGGATSGLALVGLGALYREWRRACRRGAELRGTAGVVLGGGRPNEKRSIREKSYGVALYVNTLCAIYERGEREDSALAWCVYQLQRRLSSAAFTGAVGRLGVRRVGGIDAKATACAACGKELHTPWQKAPSGVRRLPPLVPLLLSATGNFRVRELIVAPIVVLLSIALALGSFETTKIYSIPRSVHIARSETRIIPDTRKQLRIALNGPVAPGIVVRLNSRHWANRQQQGFWEGPHGSYVELPLDRLAHVAVKDKYDGEVEVVYRPTVLWRHLPAVVVERAPLRWLVLHAQPR